MSVGVVTDVSPATIVGSGTVTLTLQTPALFIDQSDARIGFAFGGHCSAGPGTFYADLPFDYGTPSLTVDLAAFPQRFPDSVTAVTLCLSPDGVNYVAQAVTLGLASFHTSVVTGLSPSSAFQSSTPFSFVPVGATASLTTQLGVSGNGCLSTLCDDTYDTDGVPVDCAGGIADEGVYDVCYSLDSVRSRWCVFGGGALGGRGTLVVGHWSGSVQPI